MDACLIYNIYNRIILKAGIIGMIKILICCLGGFSSSAMVKKVKSEIIENNLQKEMSVDFSPFMNANKLYHEYDVIMVCPHTRYEVNGFVKKHYDLNIPIYVLPPKMYGQMNAKELYIDAVDIIDGYNDSKTNPWHFKGEEEIMTVQRACSYRHFKKLSN